VQALTLERSPVDDVCVGLHEALTCNV